MDALKLRAARPEDLASITEIYNDAILTTTATFDTEPKTDAQQREWFSHHGSRHPILVAEEGDEVVGWASLSAWSDRRAYDETAELSVYVRADRRGRGIGRKLMDAILRAGKDAGLHVVLSRIVAGNPVSLELHASFGFEPVGVMKEVGRKFGRRLDVHLLQKIL